MELIRGLIPLGLIHMEEVLDQEVRSNGMRGGRCLRGYGMQQPGLGTPEAAAEAIPGAIGLLQFLGLTRLCAGECGGAQGVSGARSVRGGHCGPAGASWGLWRPMNEQVLTPFLRSLKERGLDPSGGPGPKRSFIGYVVKECRILAPDRTASARVSDRA